MGEVGVRGGGLGRPPASIDSWAALEGHYKSGWVGDEQVGGDWVHGVHNSWAHLYGDYPDKGIFTCLFSKVSTIYVQTTVLKGSLLNE